MKTKFPSDKWAKERELESGLADGGVIIIFWRGQRSEEVASRLATLEARDPEGKGAQPEIGLERY